MSKREPDRMGVLVLRAWLETHGPPLRVRISRRVGVRPLEETTVTVAGADAASRIVEDWLRHLEGPPGPRPTDEPEQRSRS